MMRCPTCRTALRPNKGWAAQFYAGYCPECDTPIEWPVHPRDGPVQITPDPKARIVSGEKESEGTPHGREATVRAEDQPQV